MAAHDEQMGVREIEPAELNERLARGERVNVLDVREPEELALASWAGARHIPMGEIPARRGELEPEREWIILCHHGVRSMQVARYLALKGFTHILNLRGGLDAWAVEVDPATPRY